MLGVTTPYIEDVAPRMLTAAAMIFPPIKRLHPDLLVASCGRSSSDARSRETHCHSLCTTSALSIPALPLDLRYRPLYQTPTSSQHKSSTPIDLTTQAPIANQDLHVADRLFSVWETEICAIKID